MKSKQEDLIKQATDYKVNVQMITFIVISILMILTLIFFIRIYIYKKDIVLQSMETEAILLESIISDHLNYSKYFIKLIGRNIRRDPNNLEYIKEILQTHFQSQDFNRLLGWRKYSWVSRDFQELVTSISGIQDKPTTVDFIKNVVKKFDNSKTQEDKNYIVFHVNTPIDQAHSLKLVDAIFDKETREFIGAVILSYNLDTIINSLNKRKTNNSINFVIIDTKADIIAKSKQEIDKIIYKNNKYFPQLSRALQIINFSSAGNIKNNAYLNMISGVNYFIKPLNDFPFAIIVNIDNNFIKNNIIKSIVEKFLEVGFFASICFIIIILIYKRETSLRTKAEKATILANNAVEAKSSFLAFTAHEIRSPLGFILTGSEVMVKELFGRMPKKYINYVEGIRNNAKLILEFITDILDEDQVTAGYFKIVNSLNRIEEIIMQAVNLHAGKKDTLIETNFAPGLPSLICDKRRLLQVIDNLITNSIKYSAERTTITISVKMQDGYMVLTIIDQGIGMKEENIPIALSKYGTVHEQNYQRGNSYGLGLPVVKMLLDAHEAILDLKSVEGQGTTVKIIFPNFKIVYSEEKK